MSDGERCDHLCEYVGEDAYIYEGEQSMRGCISTGHTTAQQQHLDIPQKRHALLDKHNEFLPLPQIFFLKEMKRQIVLYLFTSSQTARLMSQ